MTNKLLPSDTSRTQVSRALSSCPTTSSRCGLVGNNAPVLHQTKRARGFLCQMQADGSKEYKCVVFNSDVTVAETSTVQQAPDVI